ncbi:hypothetical protein PAPYR_9126 [Paratrimastix pyriformis]|uniref:Uncharacterized protein n=1 Tax=Paratrimastix pyriformis TaxID=342808 RepID=A0ABQ8U932_9EUKA|nr:hypothetical protein PAPYR_9126 [Paratrimastix pyriformis]
MEMLVSCKNDEQKQERLNSTWISCNKLRKTERSRENRVDSTPAAFETPAEFDLLQLDTFLGEYQNSKTAFGQENLHLVHSARNFSSSQHFTITRKRPAFPGFYPLSFESYEFTADAFSFWLRLAHRMTDSFQNAHDGTQGLRSQHSELFALTEGQRHPLLTPNLNYPFRYFQVDGAGQLGYHGPLPDRDEASCLSCAFPIHGLDCAARHA